MKDMSVKIKVVKQTKKTNVEKRRIMKEMKKKVETSFSKNDKHLVKIRNDKKY